MEDATWEPRNNILNPGDHFTRKMKNLKSKSLPRTDSSRRNSAEVSSKKRSASPEDEGLERRKSARTVASTSADKAEKNERTVASTSADKAEKNERTVASTSADKAEKNERSRRSSAVQEKKEKEEAEPQTEKVDASPSYPATRRASLTAKSPKVRETKNDSMNMEVTYMKHENGSYYCFLRRKSDKGDAGWRLVDEARVEYPDAMLDYLLNRVRFKTPEKQRQGKEAEEAEELK
eukprot:GHVP01037675.1.p2 GENE.GHVP01037675.1~~GHVP01037675.1.p2  ORF type:complete len:235 (-),score=68.36 GHVP01037675.1:866-1570(-)